jgi:hypothetical protein
MGAVYDSCVPLIEGMALEAVGYPNLSCRHPSPSQNVDAFCNHFQMIWIDAGRVPAEVVDHQAGRNGSYQRLVG